MTKVFLGGTCNGSTWRDKIIPMLEIGYFNPVVDDWNDAAYKRELHERETCDFCLYAITPKMIGVYSIAEVVDDSNKRPEKTVLVLLREDDDAVFKDPQWKSLQAVAKMVKVNGGQVFESLDAASDWMNSNKG